MERSEGRRRVGRPAKLAGSWIAPDTKLARNRSGVWEIRWTESGGGTGRSRSRSYSCRTTDRDVAEQVRQVWLAAGAGVAGVASGSLTTFGELARTYMQARGFREKSSQGWALRPIVAAFEGLAVGSLTQGSLTKYRLDRMKVVASGTIRRELGAFAAVMEWGRKAGVIPADLVLSVSLPPAGAARTGRLSEAEEARLWAAAEARVRDLRLPFRLRRGALFVCLALETAARESAIRGLTWDRVSSLGSAGGMIDFRDPRLAVSNKRRVPVPVSSRLAGVLGFVQAELMVAKGLTEAERKYVLRSPGAVKGGVSALLAGVGLEWVTIHDLRRTWASLRRSWGVPLDQIAAVLGDSIEVTTKHYAHYSPDYLRSAVEARGPVAA